MPISFSFRGCVALSLFVAACLPVTFATEAETTTGAETKTGSSLRGPEDLERSLTVVDDPIVSSNRPFVDDIVVRTTSAVHVSGVGYP
jgi:hypothetical protein